MCVCVCVGVCVREIVRVCVCLCESSSTGPITVVRQIHYCGIYNKYIRFFWYVFKMHPPSFFAIQNDTTAAKNVITIMYICVHVCVCV